MEVKTLHFGAYLRTTRKGRRMTIRQLAMRSGVSNAYLSQVETGKRSTPSPDVLKRLSGPLNCSYSDLMKAAGYIQPEKPEPSSYPFRITILPGAAADIRVHEEVFGQLIQKISRVTVHQDGSITIDTWTSGVDQSEISVELPQRQS